MTERRNQHPAWALAALGLAMPACFPALQDRDCASETDCFPGERCREGRCDDSAPRDAAEERPPTTRVVEVRVYDRESGAELPSATVDFDPGAGDQCSCPASESLGPCELNVPVGVELRVCARAPDHVPCVVGPIEASVDSVPVVLERCPETGPCDDLPGNSCDCEDLLPCGLRESSP